ncbi:MAG: hypothetical protein EVA80_12285 [Proteobacteria bacterium]|nr:MAG: hypothetical protein EVA80_12285 [Pseudomonadota bacterium]
MLSFKQKLEESRVSPYSLGNILRVVNEKESFRGLVISNRGSQAVLLVLTGENTGDLVHTESLQDYDISIVSEMEGSIPETRYFFQKSAAEQKIKSIEYHKSELKEDISRSDIQLWWSRARKLRKTEETNKRLDLVLEILLSEQMERRLVY